MESLRIVPAPTPYLPVWQAMQEYTASRSADSPDRIWLVEHQPVYTLGQAGRAEHLLAPGDIPVVSTDRGGQITYHGPGQVVAYVLFDLRRAGYFVKEYVDRLEAAVLDVLDELGIAGATRYPGAPGVYVPRPGLQPAADAPIQEYAKVAALGVKVRNGRTYHGISLNVAMDLAPYAGIDPCGYRGLATLDLASLGHTITLADAGERLARHIALRLTGQPPTGNTAPQALDTLALAPAPIP